MLYPRLVAKGLVAAGLPLGPLADPLPYVGTDRGKLHTDRNCRRITRQTRARIEPRPMLAADIPVSMMCGGCSSRLPGLDAVTHVQWCDVAKNALRVLANCGVKSPYSSHYDVIAESGATHAPTWRLVADIDQTLLHMEGSVVQVRPDPIDELADVLADIANRLVVERARIVKDLPGEDWTGHDRGTVIVGLKDYAPQYNQTYPRDEMYARAEIGSALPFRYAYALAAPGVAERLHGRLPLGDAEPGDSREVLQTAVRLLREQPKAALEMFLERMMREALDTARAIHTPVAR